MQESFEALGARRRMESFEAMAQGERRRVEGDVDEGPRRMLAHYEARAAEWREELARLSRDRRPGA